MKIFGKVLTLVLLAVMLMGLLPSLNTPVSAASTPILVLDSSTATASILDHILDLDTYGKGGPFTTTFEWKCSLKAINPTVPDAYASVQSIGTLYGTMTEQPDSGIRISGTTDWTKVSYTFENVGTYPMVGSNLPGNVFRFRIHDAKGQLYVKNLQIKNAAGQVVYSLNNDTVVQQLVSEMEASGLTQADMTELARINYDKCPWVANQFDSGKYTSYVILETAAAPTTTAMTKPTTTASTTTVTTTKATTTATTTTTTKATTTATTTKGTTIKPTTITTTAPTTIQPTTVPNQEDRCANGHTFDKGFCIYCAEADPDFDICGEGHIFENGYCVYCLEPDPSYNTTAATTAPTTAPTAPTTQPVADQNKESNQGDNSMTVILLLVVLCMIQFGVIAFLAVKLLKKESK